MGTWTIVTVVLFLVDALGWSIGSLVPLAYALRHKALPTVAGIRLLGGGAFESLGMDAFIPAGLVFVAVSALKIVAAYWLWHSRMDGAVLGLVLLALSAIFWYGFDLPFGWLAGVAEVVLLAIIWKTLV